MSFLLLSHSCFHCFSRSMYLSLCLCISVCLSVSLSVFLSVSLSLYFPLSLFLFPSPPLSLSHTILIFVCKSNSPLYDKSPPPPPPRHFLPCSTDSVVDFYPYPLSFHSSFLPSFFASVLCRVWRKWSTHLYCVGTCTWRLRCSAREIHMLLAD